MSDPTGDLPGAGVAAAALELRGLRVILGDQPVLRGIDLTLGRGIKLALVGPNGAGRPVRRKRTSSPGLMPSTLYWRNWRPPRLAVPWSAMPGPTTSPTLSGTYSVNAPTGKAKDRLRSSDDALYGSW